MTMGIGIACDEGVVLLTDSMKATDHGPDKPTVVSLRSGFPWLICARVAIVASGAFPEGLLDDLCTSLRHEPDPDVAASGMFTALVDAQREAVAELSEWMPREEFEYRAGPPGLGPKLLCAGGPVGEVPTLMRFSPLGGCEHSAGPAVFTVGNFGNSYATQHELELTTPPPTLKECEELALSWARDATNELYQGRMLSEFIADGVIPGWTPPFHVVAMSAVSSATRVYYR